MWKVKIRDTLVRDGCAIILKESEAKPNGMADGQFTSNYVVVEANILLSLQDNIFSNLKTIATTTKELWYNLIEYMSISL